MKKQIIISEQKNGEVSLNAKKGIKWETFIVGIELMIEIIKDNLPREMSIDDILSDIKRIYIRDHE